MEKAFLQNPQGFAGFFRSKKLLL